ncbi:hypothetical protein [Scytonema sp. NUACC21]
MKTEQDQNQPTNNNRSKGGFNKIRRLFQKILGKKKKEQSSIYPLR